MLKNFYIDSRQCWNSITSKLFRFYWYYYKNLSKVDSF